MPKATAQELLDQAGPAFVAELDGTKAARFGARTMLIPSPAQIRDSIAEVPFGAAKSLREIRAELAIALGADVTCPAASAKYWRLLAHAANEAGDSLPWWRITRDGRPNNLLPGGEARHRALLLSEGVDLAAL